MRLLERRPGFRAVLEEVLEVDGSGEAWGFRDVPVESGPFGELVSLGIVERVDGGYRLADPGAVRAALREEEEAEGGGVRVFRGMSRREAAALVVSLVLVVALRAFHFGSVFRRGDVVLMSNDPYHYLYWVERLASAGTLLDFGLLASLPGGMARGEPLMISALWFFTELVGDAGTVMALYPVLSAVFTALVVYVLGARLTGDRRAGVLAAVFLAFVPAHAVRTGLGFADHHAFDYPWLALTALALVELSRSRGLRGRRDWFFGAVLGVAVAGQTLAWDNSPVLLAPLAAYAVLGVVSDVRAGRSPLMSGAPLVLGLDVAAAVSILAHHLLGWHGEAVAYAPGLVLVLLLTSLAVGEAVHRRGLPLRRVLDALSSRELGTFGAAGLIALFLALHLVVPVHLLGPGLGGGGVDAGDTEGGSGLSEVIEEGGRGSERLTSGAEAFEAQSLLGSGLLGIVLTPLLKFGLLLLLALPYLGWATWRVYREDNPGWMVVCVYGWYFLSIALIQRRFAGELSPFVALLAAVGFLHFVGNLGLLRRRDYLSLDSPLGGRDNALRSPVYGSYLLVLLVAAVSFGLVGTPVMMGQAAVDGEAHDAALWMEDYSEERDWGYPENYVFSHWGRNRMFNYFVNGESGSYGYAKRNYGEFANSKSPGEWYRKLHDRAGFIVVRPRNLVLRGSVPENMMFVALFQRLGSRGQNASGLEHYRAVYASESGRIRVFTLVPGARILGAGPPNSVLNVSAEVELENGTFTYYRSAVTDDSGRYSLTVPYPGEYRIGETRFRVGETDVLGNRSVEAPPVNGPETPSP